jgi:hypothetical protein
MPDVKLALTDEEIVAIRRWMPVIDQTNFEQPWSETIKFAHAILTSERAARSTNNK